MSYPASSVAGVLRGRNPSIAWCQKALLTSGEAREEIEVLLLTSIILYPVENVVRLGLYATAAFELNWFDAQLWAYAEHYRCSMIYSEDFEHGRYYGSVKVINPFI